MEGLQNDAGRYRLSEIKITESKLEPPSYQDVPRHVDELCDYVNSNWTKSAVHLAAYVMWRLNWIHPFGDGNGRTARAAAYLVLCVRTGVELPGDETIPKQIAENKEPYYRALERADKTCETGTPDLRPMKDLLEELMVRQVSNAAKATWRSTTTRDSTREQKIALSSPAQTPARREKSWIAAHPLLSASIGALATIIAAVMTICTQYP